LKQLKPGAINMDNENISNDGLFVQQRTDKENWKRVSMPTFLRPDTFPIGQVLIAKVIDIVGNFTGDPNLDNTRNLLLKHQSGTEVLFPLTGVMQQALLRIGDVKGKILAIKRLPDGVSKKWKKKMFLWDIYLVEETGDAASLRSFIASNPSIAKTDK
jgi:hypothetical protein